MFKRYLPGPGIASTWAMAVLALLLAFIAFSASDSPCAYAQAACSFDDDAIVDGDFTLRSNTAFNVTLGHSATADRTITFQDADHTVVGLDTIDTLTNKTLTTPALSSPSISGAPTAAGATWADLGSATTADINGGSIDGTTIGAASAAAGTFTTVTAATLGGALNANNQAVTNVDINSGAIDGTTIGAVAAAAGTFTTVTAATLGGALNANNQAVTNVDINSGAIDGTTIGAVAAAAGNFTTVDVAEGNITNTGDVQLDSLTADGSTITVNSSIRFDALQTSRVEGETQRVDIGGSGSDKLHTLVFSKTLPDATTTPVITISAPNDTVVQGGANALLEVTWAVHSQPGSGGGGCTETGKFTVPIVRAYNDNMEVGAITTHFADVQVCGNSEVLSATWVEGAVSGAATADQSVNMEITYDTDQNRDGFVIVEARLFTDNNNGASTVDPITISEA